MDAIYSLRSSVIKTHSGKIKFRTFKAGGLPHYHIGVWLQSPVERALDQVSHVEYELHPTFTRRNRSSANRENDFSITFWAWGTFEIKAVVYFTDPSRPPVELSFPLKVELPADDGSNYEDVSLND